MREWLAVLVAFGMILWWVCFIVITVLALEQREPVKLAAAGIGVVLTAGIAYFGFKALDHLTEEV